MGHVTELISVTPKKDGASKADIELDLRAERHVRMVLEDGYSEHKLRNILLLTGKVFDDAETAEHFIEQCAEYSRFDVAVPVRQTITKAPTKNIAELNQRIQKLNQQRFDYIMKHKLSTHKSAMIGCTECGSKLSLAHMIKRNPSVYLCPVCGGDLRSKTIKETIARYDERIREAQARLDDAYKRNVKDTGKLYYLMLVNIHV